MDQQTLDTLREIHTQLQLDEEGPYDDAEWTSQNQQEQGIFIELNQMYEKVLGFAGKMINKFKKEKSKSQDKPEEQPTEREGDEMVQQLIDAWNMYSRGSDQIPCRDIGYVLRILGQNPTEDDIVEMVMEANCEWEGIMTRNDFLQVGERILRTSCNQMEDVKAAFRVFDYNNDGSISREELREALVNFGERCTEEEFAIMFTQADKNKNGRIDFDEFVDMMLPGQGAQAAQEAEAAAAAAAAATEPSSSK